MYDLKWYARILVAYGRRGEFTQLRHRLFARFITSEAKLEVAKKCGHITLILEMSLG